MNFEIFNLPFSQKIIQALSWTLVHSVWQGMILAILTGVMLLITKNTRPLIRYNILSVFLLAFVFISFFTFWLEFETQKESKNWLPTYSTSANVDFVNSAGLNLAAKADYYFNLSKYVTDFCSENASLIVAVWLLFFALKSIKAATGLYYIRRIRSVGVYDVGDDWTITLGNLAKRLKIRGRISLVESELVNVPMVAGFFKPIILVPIGFLTNLPFAQVEAILLHELAHIKRKDYLVNLFQSLAESIFFFNPAVLWISYLIRQEREHCCDDLAISVTQNKKSFVNALVVFQEYNMAGSQQAIAFAGKRNHLLDRIKRIIYNNNKQLDAMEKLFVTASLITVAALSVAFSPNAKPTSSVGKFELGKPILVENIIDQNSKTVLIDTLQKRKNHNNTETSTSTIHITRDDKSYEIEEKDGEITKLKIDGKLIPKDKVGEHQEEIDSILNELKEQTEQAENDREEAEEMRIEADKMREEANEFRKIAEKDRKKADEFRAQAEVMRKQAEEMRVIADQQRKSAEELRVSVNQNIIYAEDTKKQATKIINEQKNLNVEEIRKQAEIDRSRADVEREKAEVMRKEADLMRVEADKIREKAEITRKEAEKTREAYEKMQAELIQDLIDGGIIKDKNNLSYKLSQEELIVNDVKQSDQLHKKLKAKYIKDNAVEMVYNWKGRTGYTTTGLIYNH